jgi:hypothetical protein
MSEKMNWDAPPLAAEDERIVDAYVHLGRQLDELAYTEDFEKLVKALDLKDDMESRHWLFKRLLTLRKMGRLPRLGYVY